MLSREGEGDVTRLEFALEEGPTGRARQSRKTCDEWNEGGGGRQTGQVTAFGRRELAVEKG